MGAVVEAVLGVLGGGEGEGGFVVGPVEDGEE